MRRTLAVLVVAALTATMLMIGALPALAQIDCHWAHEGGDWWAQWCWSPQHGWYVADWWHSSWG
jgi:hypothetical protein